MQKSAIRKALLFACALWFVAVIGLACKHESTGDVVQLRFCADCHYITSDGVVYHCSGGELSMPTNRFYRIHDEEPGETVCSKREDAARTAQLHLPKDSY